MRYSFPQQLRLRNENDFKRLFHCAKRISCNNIALVSHNNNLGHPRLGVSIAKRNVRTAVVRNRIKRVIRESFRLHQHYLDELDMIVIVYKCSQGYSNAQLFTDLDELWRRLIKRSVKC